MRIEQLRIENFRRFKLVDLELADGVTVLMGRNGAGKSTLLEAIGWCLYGNDAARTSKDLIKRRGAAPHEDVRVRLAFRFGPHVYEVTRELVGKSESHTATVVVDGKIVVPAGAQSSREATAYVERVFHMERQAFFTSLVARQRELAALADAKPAERKRILVGLLRLDAIDHAIAEARAQRRDARSELAGVRSALVDVPALQKQVADARVVIEQHAARVAEMDARLTTMVDEVEDLRQQRDSGRKVLDEHRAILAQIALLDERLVATRAQHARRVAEVQRARVAASEATLLAPQVAAIPPAQKRVEALAARAIQHQELVRITAELTRAQNEATLAAAEVERTRAALASGPTLRGLAERVAAERPKLDAALVEAQKMVADLEARAREAARQVNDLGGKERRVREMGPESPCPTCTRPLREHYGELLGHFGQELATLRAQLDEQRPALDAARKEEAALRQRIADLAARDTELRQKLQALAVDEERLVGATARLADAQARAARHGDAARAMGAEPFDPKELEAARAALRALEIARDKQARLLAEAEREAELTPLVAEFAAQLDAATAQRAEAEARRVALAFDAAAHEALEAAATAAEARLHEGRLQRERLVSERVRREDEAKRLAETLASQEALAARVGGLERRVLLLERLAGERDAGLLPEFKDHLIARIRPLLSLHAGRLFRELTEGRYADLEVDDSYDLVVHDEGEAFALARFSGGEADLANLCLRLAVSQVVAERAGSEGFGFLALDEIFGSQDEIRKGNILRALQALSGRFRQILLITHISDVKESAENVLRVEALDDGTSRVVVEG